MPNGDVKVNWSMVRDVAQVLIYPLLACMVYLLLQNSSFDRRLAVIEITTSRPVVDIESVKKIAILEDRQNRNIARVEYLAMELEKHRENSVYDPTGLIKRIPRER